MDDRVPSESERCCFDDWVDHWERQARKGETVAGVSRHLLDALTEAGLEGRTVLDVGCGIGDLGLTALERGAAQAVGYDLSTKAIERARVLAAERGLAERASFTVGDVATVDLAPADVVVLNRVVCCYRDAYGLLDRSLAAARAVYAFTAPVSSGPIGLLNRAWTRVWNVVYALRKRRYAGFRTYVHDVDRIDERVRRDGFRPLRRERRRLVWQVLVYAR